MADTDKLTINNDGGKQASANAAIKTIRMLSATRPMLGIIVLTTLVLIASGLPYKSKRAFMGLAAVLLIYSWFNLIALFLRVYYDNKTSFSGWKITSVVLCMLLTYSGVFFALQLTDDDSFVGNVHELDKIAKHKESGAEEPVKDEYVDSWKGYADFCYFTITTMTTVGYGDISPRSYIARFLVVTLMISAFIVVSVMLGFSKS